MRRDQYGFSEIPVNTEHTETSELLTAGKSEQ